MLAQLEARLLNHGFIGTEHILLGLIHEGDGLAAKVLERCGMTLPAVRGQVEEKVGVAGRTPTGSQPFTPRAKKVLELALREALHLSHNYIGTEHLLLGLIDEGEGVATQVLQSLGVDLEVLRADVFDFMSGLVHDVASSEGCEGTAKVATGVTGTAARVDGPTRQRCGAGLAEEARYRVIDVPGDDPDADEEVLSVRVIYCSRCRTAIGTA